MRLRIDWLEPVRVQLALDYDEHRNALRAAARGQSVRIGEQDPHNMASDKAITSLRVATDGPGLAIAAGQRDGTS